MPNLCRDCYAYRFNYTMIKFLLPAFTFFFSVAFLKAEKPKPPAKSTKRNLRILPVPTLGYAPETKSYLGAVCQFGFRTAQNEQTRMSTAKIELQYTQNKQFIGEISGTVFTPDEKWLFSGTAHASKFPDRWWEFGVNAADSNMTKFNSTRLKFDVSALKNIGNKWFAGPVMKWQQYSDIEPIITNLSKAFTINTGLQALRDTRDNILNAAKGVFKDIQLGYNRADAFEGFKITADWRGYYQYKKRLVLAGRAYLNGLEGKTHFFDYPMYGGDKFLRGYYFGRFREQTMWLLTAEARVNIFRRYGLTAFYGTGSVMEKWQDVMQSELKPGYGIGFRFMADRKERINLRIDYARGKDGQSGFYFAFGEAF